MTVTRIIGPNTVYVKSGKTRKINVTTDSSDKKEKGVTLNTEGKIDIDAKGIITAQKVRSGEWAKVFVTAASDSLITKEINVYIEAGDSIKIKSKNNQIISGQEFTFEAKSDFDIRPRWRIVDYERRKGDIDPISGVYRAPDVISQQFDVEVEVVDQNSGYRDRATLTLLPLEIQKGNQPSIRAGSGWIQLNIWVYRDGSGGRDNFDCRIISDPTVGRVSEGGWYEPPNQVAEAKDVTVEARSKKDPTIKNQLDFQVIPSCPKCSVALDSNNICHECGYRDQDQGFTERCPRCNSSRWDGVRCKRCNYPKKKKKIA
jgi:hypothetical protein